MVRVCVGLDELEFDPILLGVLSELLVPLWFIEKSSSEHHLELRVSLYLEKRRI